jgi:putative ATP-dependent endonuclease of OLD family
MHGRFNALAHNPDSLDPTQFLKDIESVGKGRVAQRLASIFVANRSDVCPSYIKAALDYLQVRLA